MALYYDEFELTDSAYRHGFDDDDFAEMIRGRCLVIRNRRGKMVGYEIFGRNRGGTYLLAAARVIKYQQQKILRVFHLNRMSDSEKKRYRREIER